MSTTDSINIVHPDDWATSEYASIFEFTRVVGIRMTQIQHGAQPYVTYDDADTIEDIVLRELAQKRCPLSIIRKVGSVIEVVPMNSLIMPRI